MKININVMDIDIETYIDTNIQFTGITWSKEVGLKVKYYLNSDMEYELDDSEVDDYELDPSEFVEYQELKKTNKEQEAIIAEMVKENNKLLIRNEKLQMKIEYLEQENDNLRNAWFK